jgi:hypothetical protein
MHHSDLAIFMAAASPGVPAEPFPHGTHLVAHRGGFLRSLTGFSMSIENSLNLTCLKFKVDFNKT